MTTNAQFPVLLNVRMDESDNHCNIRADITGFRAKNVRVTPWEDSLVVEMQVEDDPGQSFYLGEAEPECYRRIIPLGFQIDGSNVMTHYQGGKLKISVMKKMESTVASGISCTA